ncbi:GMC oxidoreductase [Patellaria atrata CBS 101060]|uniref:GMC oxidoreductase n=1 Tax=Patellaria atrata CBS 101060 TaxID=1346257 RepID=A0A9P4S2K8_9PEZI|nr:GMC oxidoreductase [Patellaria atrata CBS 101060]
MVQDTFDFILVGGGLAGCVLASRLSAALLNHTFLLIEAGPAENERVRPAVGVFMDDNSEIEWPLRTVPQKSMNGLIMKQEQGKVLGGGSAINYQSWIRGARGEYDHWAEKIGDPRWSWQGLLPYFIKSETFLPGLDLVDVDTTVHGTSGPIKVAQMSSSGLPRNYPLKGFVTQVYRSIGVSFNPDVNSGVTLGYSEHTCSTYKGQRQWAASCYPNSDNLTVLCDTHVSKVVFDGVRTTGIELRTSRGAKMLLKARQEVILCSGVYGSPKLLILSGIGPSAQSERLGIPKVLDLPVGENLTDHLAFMTFWKFPNSLPLEDDIDLLSDKDCDPLAGPPLDYFAFLRHDEESIQELAQHSLSEELLRIHLLKDRPHTENYMIYTHLDVSIKPTLAAESGTILSMSHVFVSPTSRGTVRLTSADPNDLPIIDPRFLSNDLDRQLLYACARSAMNMMITSETARKYGVQEYGIDESLRNDVSDAALGARLNRTGFSMHHPGGTCAMGSVVDNNCNVIGAEGLRVIDGSIIPFPLGCHYQAPLYAIAEMMSDVIIEQYQTV